MNGGAQLTAVSPILLVRDVVQAAAYYAGALGFHAPKMWGDPPHFCIPRRDGLTVMLNQVRAGDGVHPNADHEGRFDVYFEVADVDALHDEYRGSGADIVCAPEDLPYGMREFQVRDPDGHLLAFGQYVPGLADD